MVCICALPLLSWRKDVIVVECNPPNNPSLRFVWNCTVVSASPIPSSLVRPPLLSSPLPSRFVLLPPVLSLLPLWPCPLPSPSRDVLRACYSLLPIVLMCCLASASMLTSSKSWSATRALRSVAYLSLAKLPGVEVQLSALVRKECLHCRVLKERVREVSNWVFERFGSIYIYGEDSGGRNLNLTWRKRSPHHVSVRKMCPFEKFADSPLRMRFNNQTTNTLLTDCSDVFW